MTEYHEDEDKLLAIRNWAAEPQNVWFNTEFVESLEDALDEHGELTDGQSEALDSILTKLNISVEAYANA